MNGTDPTSIASRAHALRLAALILLIASLGVLGRADVQRVPTGTWADVAGMGAVAQGAASVVLPDGRIFACGGIDSDGKLLATAAVYDPATHVWTPVGQLSVPRSSHAAAALPDGRLVIAGYHQDGQRQINMQLWNWRGLDVFNAHERDPQVYVRGIREALDAVVSHHLDPTPLYTHRYPLARLRDAFRAQRDKPEGFVKALVIME
jgi:hypothetical protein